MSTTSITKFKKTVDQLYVEGDDLISSVRVLMTMKSMSHIAHIAITLGTLLHILRLSDKETREEFEEMAVILGGLQSLVYLRCFVNDGVFCSYLESMGIDTDLTVTSLSDIATELYVLLGFGGSNLPYSPEVVRSKLPIAPNGRTMDAEELDEAVLKKGYRQIVAMESHAHSILTHGAMLMFERIDSGKFKADLASDDRIDGIFKAYLTIARRTIDYLPAAVNMLTVEIIKVQDEIDTEKVKFNTLIESILNSK